MLSNDKTEFTFRLHTSELYASYATLAINMHMQFHRDVNLQTSFYLSSMFTIGLVAIIHLPISMSNFILDVSIYHKILLKTTDVQ